jgi:hypothetical protein
VLNVHEQSLATIPRGITSETYSQQQLKDLVQSHWNLATAWTYDRYASTQNSFADVRESTFDTWDESRLHKFLRE